MSYLKSPHYLSRSPKGVFYFRYSLSARERAQLKQNEIHWSLRTSDLRLARRLALTLHDLVPTVLSRGRDMNVKYSELQKNLLDLKRRYIKNELRVIYENGPLTVEQRQVIKERIAIGKVELQMQEPSDDEHWT